MAIDVRDHPFFQDGHAEGRVEGRVEGKAELLVRQLTNRLGDLGPARTSAIAGLAGEELDALSDRVLTLATTSELDDWLRER